MATKPWYVWDDAKERFVRAKRPPQDAQLAAALRQLRIRLADQRDRQKLFEFHREAYETEPEIWLEGELDLCKIRQGLDRWSPAQYSNNFVVIAELGRKIISLLLLVIYYRIDEGSPLARIENLLVLKKYRGYKVATRLLESAKELARQKGCKGLSLIVGLENPPALRLYRKKGFKINKVGYASLGLTPSLTKENKKPKVDLGRDRNLLR